MSVNFRMKSGEIVKLAVAISFFTSYSLVQLIPAALISSFKLSAIPNMLKEFKGSPPKSLNCSQLKVRASNAVVARTDIFSSLVSLTFRKRVLFKSNPLLPVISGFLLITMVSEIVLRGSSCTLIVKIPPPSVESVVSLCRVRIYFTPRSACNIVPDLLKVFPFWATAVICQFSSNSPLGSI